MAYNPAANGLVERFHRSLKVSLTARCTAEDWKYQLLWVLLGLRTVTRADGAPSAAEKTYGKPLVVPGKLVTGSPQPISPEALRNRQQVRPLQEDIYREVGHLHAARAGLHYHVFVRDDVVHPPLTRPYRGPFRALERNSKAFLLTLHGRNNWVSID
ncbi:uncharacterized protein [Macrobrachium rosenbergii]|uniref:uncharacterized protein n=1 Tax=Macrobrachium rosenbergii TaxID=79674 RepID=UPI0034D451A8